MSYNNIIPLWFTIIIVTNRSPNFKYLIWGTYENKTFTAVGGKVLPKKNRGNALASTLRKYLETRPNEYFEVHHDGKNVNQIKDFTVFPLSANAFWSDQNIYQRFAYRNLYNLIHSTIKGYTRELQAQFLATSNLPDLTKKSAPIKPATNKKPDPPVVIATDGSFHAHYGGSSYAWINDKGHHKSGTVKSNSIMHAELVAIREALTHAPKKAHVTILSDSQDALNHILVPHNYRNFDRKAQEVRKLVETIKQLEKQFTGVTYSWVKAHNGSPLNEAADSLARNRRLAVFNQLDMPTLNKIENNIVSNAMHAYRATAEAVK